MPKRRKAASAAAPTTPVVKAAKDALDALFSDTSVSQQETRDRLKDLREEIDTCLDALQDKERW